MLHRAVYSRNRDRLPPLELDSGSPRWAVQRGIRWNTIEGDMPESIEIAPILNGLVSPSDLLQTTSTIFFTYVGDPHRILFHVESDDFIFNLSHHNNEWILRRNEYVVRVKPDYASHGGKWPLFVEWTPELLRFSDGLRNVRQPTRYTRPPPALIRFARLNKLVPCT